MRKLTVGSCFSGIGGLEKGLEDTGGFETKWQIENDPYASAVLKKHWPGVKRYSDITQVDGKSLERVDVICGGFPCQDVSFAGKRAGLEGKRSTLWGELFRLVCEVKPRWLLAENVPGLLSSDDGRFFGNILRDLASIGFDAEWGVLSAAGVGAPHLRRRVFILAHPMRCGGRSESGVEQSKRAEVFNPSGEGNVENTRREHGQERPEVEGNAGRVPEDGQTRDFTQRSSPLAHSSIDTRRISNRDGKNDVSNPDLETARRLPIGETETLAKPGLCCEVLDPASQGLQNGSTGEIHRSGSIKESERSDWWAIEPNVGRVANGVPSRVDRLRCLGNAVVPQVAEKVGRMILDSF